MSNRKEDEKMKKIKPHLRQFFTVKKIGPTPKLGAVRFWPKKSDTGFETDEEKE